MNDFISPLLQWLNAHPSLAGIATFIISAGESVAIIGTIVPGSVMMTAIGTLAGAGIIPLWSTIIWAILGAIVGDGISYWLGYYFKDRLRGLWPFAQYPHLLTSGEQFVRHYGIMSVFLGRFIGPVRALVPLVAGMLGMRPFSFTIANIFSAIGWAPLYMLPGMLLGAASLELPPDIGMHVFIVLLLLGLGCMLAIWIVIQLIRLISKQIDQALNRIWQALKKSDYFSSVTTLLRHHDPAKQHGQLTLAFYCLLSALLCAGLMIYVAIHASASLTLNNTVYYLARGLRTATADPTLIAITMLGEKTVVLPALVLVCLWLCYHRLWRTTYHMAALSLLGAGCIIGLKHLIHSPRPLGILQNAHDYAFYSYSMPSGHTVLITLFGMSIAFLVANNSRWKYTSWGTAAGLIILVSLSRLYLGAHWFTDVLGGWLLSATLLTFICLSYLRYPVDRLPPIKLLGISLSALLFSYGMTYHYRHTSSQHRYMLVSLPQKTASLQQWWDNSVPLFADRTNLFGFPSQYINIQWAGELTTIEQTLRATGWQPPPARNWISILYRLTGVHSTQYIPLISPQYLDEKPSIILMRRVPQKNTLFTVRLWDAKIRLMENNHNVIQLWVGVINKVTNTYSWFYQRYPGSVNITTSRLLGETPDPTWQVKLLQNMQPNKYPIERTMLLIKSSSATMLPSRD